MSARSDEVRGVKALFNGSKVIDVHGHISAPAAFRSYLMNMLSQNTAYARESRRGLRVSDEDLGQSQTRHLKGLDERQIDLQIIGPRPIGMFHWMRPFLQVPWCQTTNDITARIVKLHPERFAGAAQLPQNSQIDTRNCIEELERCVKELGMVTAYLNPDPAGDNQTPGVHEEYWYPLYEKAQELDIPLTIHATVSKDTRLEPLTANYQVNHYVQHFIARLLYSNTNVFDIFPRLRVVICHCGGAPDRFSKKDPRQMPQRDLSQNLWVDSCSYDEEFLRVTILQRGVDQMLFGTEHPGSGDEAVHPVTGRPSDDLVPVIDSFDFLTNEDKLKIFNRNAIKVFPGLVVA